MNTLMTRRAFIIFVALATSLPVATAIAQPDADLPDFVLDDGGRAAVIDALLQKLNSVYVFPDVAKKMDGAIRARQARREYDRITSGREFAEILTNHLREVCKDGHLGVEYSVASIPRDSEDKPPPAEEINRFRENGRRRNYEFKKVERLDGGIGLLQLDAFYPGEWISDTAAAAMTFLANSDAIILDLRNNHGFAPTGGTLICSYFFKEETRLSDQFNRSENTTRQYWTYSVVPGASLADKDLYILTSSQTFSAPEAFAYDMQALKRATIVGETTGGGAHGTTTHRLADHFRASIPFSRSINPVTKTDWEGVGVKPDVVVPADQALLTAHLIALKKTLEKHAGDRERADGLKRTITDQELELGKMKENRPSR
jgi:retinol-binding protein 3